MSRDVGYIREELERLRAENERLRLELEIAQGANKALEEFVKGYRIRGKEPVWVGLYREQCNGEMGADQPPKPQST
jgi:hypothetical protein